MVFANPSLGGLAPPFFCSQGTVMYKLSKYTILSDPFYEKHTHKARQVAFSGISGQARVLHPQVVDHLGQGELSRIPQQLVEELCRAGILVEENQSEAQQILSENRRYLERENILYQVIQPSAWCQLGCGYCGQAHEKKVMDEKAVEAIYQRVADALKSDQYKHLHIGWFGAEPLTGLPVIRVLSRQFIALSKAHGVNYSAKIVTNGLALTAKIFQQLSALNVAHFEITLDGPEQVHDNNRPMKDGGGSYRKILGNLQEIVRIKDRQRITVRVNVGINNFEAIPALIDEISALNLQSGVGVYFAPLHDWGNDAGKDSLSMEAFSQHELAWYAQLLENGFQLGLIPGRKKQVCMSLSPTSEVYDAYGDIFNCSELSQVPAYGKPNRHRIGNLELIATSQGQRLFADFNDKIDRGETTCRECYCLPVCGGACPKSWEEGKIPCPSFKYNFKQRLLLQYASQYVKSCESSGVMDQG